MPALRSQAFATVASVLVTFPPAAVWHAGLFASTYRAFGYFEEEPSFGPGSLAIVAQGVVASHLYAYVRFRGRAVVCGFTYARVIGVFFWTSHVLAFAAKQSIGHMGALIAMETGYVITQLGSYGDLLGIVFPEPRLSGDRSLQSKSAGLG